MAPSCVQRLNDHAMLGPPDETVVRSLPKRYNNQATVKSTVLEHRGVAVDHDVGAQGLHAVVIDRGLGVGFGRPTLRRSCTSGSTAAHGSMKWPLDRGEWTAGASVSHRDDFSEDRQSCFAGTSAAEVQSDG